MNTTRLIRSLSLIAAAVLCTAAASSQVETVTQVTRSPELFGRVDFVASLKASWDDPYRASDVSLDMVATAPSGDLVTVPAYYEKGASGRTSVWHVRFAPRQTGDYRAHMVLTSRDGVTASSEFMFHVAPSPSRGFLHTSGPWILRFDNGEPFRGVGENLCWESRSSDDSRYFEALHENPRFDFDYLMGRLASHGGNFTRVWMCPWNLPLEWRKVSPTTDRYRDDPGHFNASAITRMDAFVETAAASGVYVMLTLDPHGSLLGGDWARSNYNAANGGPCAKPADFFTDPRARAQYKDRLRYLVARWGYSPHIAAWEFFNEVDNAMYGQEPERIADAVVTAWHAEMSAYLRKTDPYGHIITTSISHRDVAGMDDIASIDLNQKHIYRHTDQIPGAIRDYVKAHGKPYVIGEFGYEWDWSKNFNDFAGSMDRDFKLGLWLGLFSPTPILPMSWWWEFFDQRGMTAYFEAVSMIEAQMLRAGAGSFESVACTQSGCTTLAVRCGREVFACTMNLGATPVNADLVIAVPGLSSPRFFDPETRTWVQRGSIGTGAGESRIAAPAIAPGQFLIIEATQAPGAPGAG